MSGPVARAALAHRKPLTAGNAAWLVERALAGLLVLRGERAEIGAVAGEVLGAALPGQAGASIEGPRAAALWLGPDEWLLVTATGAEGTLQAALADALAGWHHQLVDVSDYYTIIEVGGTRARALLSRLMVIDLHPRAFAAGQAFATVLAKAHVWIRLADDARHDGEPYFMLFVRRSLADYVWCLLAEAGRTWGLPAQTPVGAVKLHLPHFEA